MMGLESQVVPYRPAAVPVCDWAVVFAPHPDDEVFGCGGVLALLRRAGVATRVVLLTAGEAQQGGCSATAAACGGGNDGDVGQPRGDRVQESREALASLGVEEVACWGLPDRGVRYREDLVQRVADDLRLLQGSVVVFAPSLWEAHPDHRACAMAVAEALRRLGRPGWVLWQYEVSVPLRANALVDITSVWAEKARAMQAFASQEAVLPYSRSIEGLNRYRSLTIQPARYAEAFEVRPAEGLRLWAIEAPAWALRQEGGAATPEDGPLVSVVVRTMGRPTLAQTVASVQAQTHANWELVLVNAAGDADLPQRAMAGWGEVGALRWVGQGRRLGRSEAANVGLEAAAGQWVLLLDDDDWLYPDHLARLLAAARLNPAARALYADVQCVDGAGEPSGPVFAIHYAPNELKYGNFLPIHAVLFDRALVQEGARFDESLDVYEDWDFWLQVERLAGGFVRVPGVSAAYRMAAGAGAGVRMEEEQARSATDAIYAKWGVQWGSRVFGELLTRSLHRRWLLLELQQAQRDVLALQRAHDAAVADRDAALSQAQQARLDAHHFKQAHDAAVLSRDDALGQRDQALERLAQVQAGATVAQSQALQAEARAAAALSRADALQVWLQVARGELAQKEAALQAAASARGTLEAEVRQTHARLYQAELRAQQVQVQLDQVMVSRSWRLTAPLRWATRLAQRVSAAVRLRGWRGAAQRVVAVVRQDGMDGLLQKMKQSAPKEKASEPQKEHDSQRDYARWLAEYDTLTPEVLSRLAEELAALRIRPRISLVMPVFNPRESDLREAIASVQAQLYGEWELCICDDASTQPHVAAVLQEAAAADGRIRWVRHEVNRHISAATRTAMGLATGQWVGFLDHDDTLAPHALLRVVQWIAAHPQHRLLYSDEDKIGVDGQRFDPYFKPDFNLGLLRSHNYLCHFAVMERELLMSLGGPRDGFEGAQDYDLLLRAVDVLKPQEIGHLPHVLYHWRVTPGSTAGGHAQKSYAFEAGRRALAEHVARRGLRAQVEEAPEAPGMYRLRWQRPAAEAPLVSIIIPTRNGAELLRMCLDTLKRTAYPNYEVVVVDNGSDDPQALALMHEREQAGQIRVLRDERPFNFSALNNHAVRSACRGDWLVLMNNDIEITHPEWLDEMMGVASEPGVGCVGARLWYPDGRLQHGGVIMVCGVAGHAHKYLPRGAHGYMGRAVLAQDFLAVTAACLLVSRRVFEEVGGLDEGLQVAFNDVDFCLKVHSAGYRNVWTPYAELVHHESVTRGYEDTPEKQRRFASEIQTLQTRWSEYLAHDPCYSPNLTDQAEDFSFAWPPRRPQP